MQLYALLLLWLLIPRTTYKCSQLSLSNWKQLCYTVIMSNTLIRTFTNVSRRLFKSMHFMHRWWSSSEARKAPLWRQRESSVCCMSRHFPASYLSTQTATPSSRELLTCLTLLHPLQTEALQPANEWNYLHSHKRLPENPFICFLPSYCYSQVVSEQCCTTYNISTTPCTPDPTHNTSKPQEYICSNVPTIFHRFLSTRLQ